MTSLPTTYKRWLLVSRPTGNILHENFKLVEEKIDPTIKDGEIFVRVIYVSLDPTLIGWTSEKPPYTPQIKLGTVMNCSGIGQVIDSKCDKFKHGDFVVGLVGFQEYAVLSSSDMQFDKVNDDPKYPLHIALNNFGITGLTGYFGMINKAEPKEGETLLVSGAAGATGMMAACIGKIKGCRVIGIAGSDEKCKNLLEKLKLDGVINYKTENVDEQIKKHCPKGVNIYFDNVGGPILDTVLNNLSFGARIVACGAISQYTISRESQHGIKNLMNIIFTEAQVRGVFLLAHRNQFHEAAKEIHQWLEEGKLPVLPVTLTKGIEHTINAFIGLFEGKNEGKSIVEFAAPPAPYHD